MTPVSTVDAYIVAQPAEAQPRLRELRAIIRAAVPEVRQIARTYLESVSDSDLDALAPYTGSLAALKGRMVTLRYTLLRISAHHYFHIGDIASVRSRRLGQQVGDYPNALTERL